MRSNSRFAAASAFFTLTWAASLSRGHAIALASSGTCSRPPEKFLCFERTSSTAITANTPRRRMPNGWLQRILAQQGDELDRAGILSFRDLASQQPARQ